MNEKQRALVREVTQKAVQAMSDEKQVELNKEINAFIKFYQANSKCICCKILLRIRRNNKDLLQSTMRCLCPRCRKMIEYMANVRIRPNILICEVKRLSSKWTPY